MMRQRQERTVLAVAKRCARRAAGEQRGGAAAGCCNRCSRQPRSAARNTCTCLVILRCAACSQPHSRAVPPRGPGPRMRRRAAASAPPGATRDPALDPPTQPPTPTRHLLEPCGLVSALWRHACLTVGAQHVVQSYPAGRPAPSARGASAAPDSRIPLHLWPCGEAMPMHQRHACMLACMQAVGQRMLPARQKGY
jgi:hypothetical protein